MKATRVVVVSPSRTLGTALSDRLSSHFEIVTVHPGPEMFEAVRECRASIAVIDRIDERPETAQLEIAVLKELSPGVEIIALSDNSSDRDASVIEQGIFYYAAAVSLGQLTRLIHAAERSAAARGVLQP